VDIHPKTAAMLGFARRSKRLVLGESALEQGVKSGRIRLVILAEDVPLKKREIWGQWCRRAGIPFLISGTREAYARIFNIQLQGFIGVTDVQMAQAILNNHSQLIIKDGGGD
jgi:ribosomal protein L7Ae-like RNA K-turn-binding protein